jgi:hypothetical protein
MLRMGATLEYARPHLPRPRWARLKMTILLVSAAMCGIITIGAVLGFIDTEQRLAGLSGFTCGTCYLEELKKITGSPGNEAALAVLSAGAALVCLVNVIRLRNAVTFSETEKTQA